MTATLIFLAIVMAVVVWWLLRQTVNVKPWVASAPTGETRGVGLFPPAKVALGVLLAVITSLFALFISAYSIRMELADWRPLPEPTLLWVNTGLLLAASIGLQWAWRSASREQPEGVRLGLYAGGGFALAFIVSQLIAWQQLTAAGYLLTSNPANSFFYVLTGLHVLHLAGGLVALWKTLGHARSEDTARARLWVELCAGYWHFLFVVWLVLFGLLLST